MSHFATTVYKGGLLQQLIAADLGMASYLLQTAVPSGVSSQHKSSTFFAVQDRGGRDDDQGPAPDLHSYPG